MIFVRAHDKQGIRRPLRGIRLIYLAPVLAFIALSAWAFASPIGASPDDDYHLVSAWCADGGGVLCEPGSEVNTRVVASAFRDVACFAGFEEQSADCQVWDANTFETARGNFSGEYPPIFYSTMGLFTGADIQTGALLMRLANAALFVGLVTALAALLPSARRGTLLWAWLVTLVPLGMFLIPSNNPSGWAVVGVGTAYIALLGWFEARGRRRWALGALYIVGILMAAGSRGDSSVYVIGATITVLILTAARTHRWALSAIFPVAGIVVALMLLASAGQAGVGAGGLTGGTGMSGEFPLGGPQQDPLSGPPLVAFNILALPYLWSGVWGTWALGWFDTDLPAIVPAATSAAFVVVIFAGAGRMDWRKLIASSGVLFVLIVLPVYVLSVGGDRVGRDLQPRYLLPLIVLFAFLLITDSGRGGVLFTRLQTLAILGGLAIANLVALEVNIRRYITGTDAKGFDLDSGAEWWWTGFPIGPNVVWIVGTLAYVGLLVVLWPELRRTQRTVTSTTS